jgi:hypothetical protein
MRTGDLSGSSAVIYNPFTGAANGTGREPFPNNRIPTTLLDPIALKILQDLPQPNLGTGAANNFFASGPVALTHRHLPVRAQPFDSRREQSQQMPITLDHV